jgi:transcription factor WhiB
MPDTNSCPALTHLTLRTVTRGPRETRCRCQGWELILDRKREMTNAARKRSGRKPLPSLRIPFLVSPLPGRGPWRILADCPAPAHNTEEAATSCTQPRCVCPRALDIKEHVAERKRAFRMSAARKGRQPGSTNTPPYWLNVRTGHAAVPDLADGACRTPAGLAVLDRGGNAAARQLCATCPFATKYKCANWALSEELPAGSWGGVYGGMTPLERKKLMRELEQGKGRSVAA